MEELPKKETIGNEEETENAIDRIPDNNNQISELISHNNIEELMKEENFGNEEKIETAASGIQNYISQISEVPTCSGNNKDLSAMCQDVLMKEKKCSVLLKSCKVVYIGTKIDYSCQQLITNNSSKELIDEKFAECRDRLKNYYRRANAYMRSLFWEGKRRDLPIKEYFVELTLRGKDEFGEKKEENLQLEEIFSEQHGNRIILFIADAGYGKTTLCKKIAYDWSVEQSGYLQHFDFVVVITLRELRISIIDTLLEKVCGNSEELRQELLRANANFLVIFDGLDEIREKNLVLEFLREESVSISLRMTIVITCRPHVEEYIREDCDSIVSIEGFTERKQQEYIALMFKSEESKTIDFDQILDGKKFYSGIMDCPLMLHLLCCLGKTENLQSIHNTTELFIRIFSLMIKRYVKKTGHCDFLKEGKLFLGEDLLVKLGNLTFYSERIFKKDLKKCFPIEEEYNFILGIDLLCPYVSTEADDYMSFDFVHATFRRFLLARILYEILKEKQFNAYYNNEILLFLLGIPGSDPFPDEMLRYLSKIVFSPEMMLRAYVEINNENKWNTFCSVTNVICCSGELGNLTKLFTYYQFSRIYLCLPPTKYEFEKMSDEIIEFHAKYTSSNRLEIDLYLSNLDNFMSVFGIAYTNYRDIREPASLIVDFLYNLDLSKFDIHFCGLTECGINFVAVSSGGYFDMFRSIENPISLPEEVKNKMGISTNTKFVALKVIDCIKSRAVCQDDLFIFIHSAFVNYLVTIEQYESLQKYINTFPPLQFLAVQRETFNLFYICKPTFYACSNAIAYETFYFKKKLVDHFIERNKC